MTVIECNGWKITITKDEIIVSKTDGEKFYTAPQDYDTGFSSDGIRISA